MCVIIVCTVGCRCTCRYIHNLEEQRRSPIWHPYRRHFRRWLRSAENPVLHVAVGLRRNSSRAGRSTDSFSAPARRFDLRLRPSARALAIFPEILGDAVGRRWTRRPLPASTAGGSSCSPSSMRSPQRTAWPASATSSRSCPRRRAAASSSRLRGRSSAATRRPGMAGDPVASRCPGPGARR